MSFSCINHGWNHLLNPCPLCFSGGTYTSSGSSDSLVGITGAHYQDMKTQLAAKDAEIARLKDRIEWLKTSMEMGIRTLELGDKNPKRKTVKLLEDALAADDQAGGG